MTEKERDTWIAKAARAKFFRDEPHASQMDYTYERRLRFESNMRDCIHTLELTLGEKVLK